MSLIPGYEYDIFISYAHVDNLAYPGQTAGWIEQFYANLNIMLAKQFGRTDSVKLWWDNKKLDGNVMFDQSIETGIRKSAVMICLHSPGYLASAYCKQELDTFYKKAIDEPVGLKIGDRSRIVHILLNNLPFSSWPTELNGSTGFPFHDAKEEGDLGDPLDAFSPEFRTQMQNVRDAISKLLNDFLHAQPVHSSTGKLPVEQNPDQFTIYLGEVADTLRIPRKRMISELEKQGYTIITGVPPPDEAQAHEQATKEALKQADLAIHLLDEYPGREIIGAPNFCYPQKQAELGMKAKKPQMIWVPEELDLTTIEDVNYKTFIEQLENGQSSGEGFEFVRGLKSNLAQQVRDYAEQLKESRKSKSVGNGSLSVLLDTHFKDQLYALDLCKSLIENQIQPFMNPQDDDPRKNINLLGDRLSQVRKLIFLYGNVSKEWVLERMSAALQLIITNNYPIEDFYIYMAPPHKEANGIALNQRFLKVNVIDNSQSSDTNNITLHAFLTSLKSETK